MARCKSPFTKICFPSATLIRLYKLLKNNSRLSKAKTGKPQHRFSSMLWFANLRVFLHLVLRWWRMTGSNRRPPACKAGALPAELIPLKTAYASLLDTLHSAAMRRHLAPSLSRFVRSVVGLAGFEPATPALSRRCSNRLSYRPTILSIVSLPHALA